MTYITYGSKFLNNDSEYIVVRDFDEFSNTCTAALESDEDDCAIYTRSEIEHMLRDKVHFVKPYTFYGLSDCGIEITIAEGVLTVCDDSDTQDYSLTPSDMCEGYETAKYAIEGWLFEGNITDDCRASLEFHLEQINNTLEELLRVRF